MSSFSGSSGETRTVLVTGHESAGDADLAPILESLSGAVATSSGRPLHETVTALLAEREDRVVVVPITWGRDPGMVSDTAKTLRRLAAEGGAGRVAQSADFGSVDHLVAWLRRAAVHTASRPNTSLVITAPSSNPRDDAALYRIAHLVRTHGAGVPVEVACVAESEDLARAVRRTGLLGSDDTLVVSAGFARAAPPGLPFEQASFFGPLLSEQALVEIIRRRVAVAEHDLQHGHDGIETELLAEHDHGSARSHDFETDGVEHSRTPSHQRSRPPPVPHLDPAGTTGAQVPH